MTAQTWRVSHRTSSRLFRASVLICAMLLLSSPAALAQFKQDGKKLVGMLATGAADQGASVAVSADGDTAIVGGWHDNSSAGAAWVFTRSGEVWTQQGGKLVGTGAVGVADQGYSVALSADGDTAIVGGPLDNYNSQQPWNAGAAWVFTRSGGVWSQQGGKLVGTGVVGGAGQGQSVALSADGDTAIVGGPLDNSDAGAAWVFTRSGGVWKQQGGKLVGTGAGGNPARGASVALCADGETAIVGGSADQSVKGATIGATWVFTRSGGVWKQQGAKLVGTGAVPETWQGYSVSLSGDGGAAIVGGPGDNDYTGAAWVFVQPLEVSPYAGIVASGTKGGPFSPSSFVYKLRATSGSVNYTITGAPVWLTASSTSGTLTTAWTTITFTINASANTLAAGAYSGTIEFNNADGVQSSIPRAATLTVKP
jgi:hypothetical protein